MSNSEAESTFSLTLEEFMKYKDVNTSMLPTLRDVANNMNFRVRPKRSSGPNNAWRKESPSANWLLQNKLKQTEDDKLTSEFRGILNKLSSSNFNELAKEIVTLDIKKKEHLIILVDAIFMKAITESKFADMYAKLSKELASYYIEEGSDEENKESQNIYFRELLINKCQIMFNDIVSISGNNENGDNITPRTKEQILGCITFIGELYNQELLTDKIIFSCFRILFVKVGTGKEHIIDSLCVLIKTVGKNFSTRCKKESTICYDKFVTLKDSKNIPNKDKFNIMDVLDLLKSYE
jgi:translation initiation factor 4G